MTLRPLFTAGLALALCLGSGALVAACDSSTDADTGEHDHGDHDHDDDGATDDTMEGMDHGDDTMADLDMSTSLMSADGSYMVSYETAPSPIPHNEHFDLTVTVMGGENHDEMPVDLTVTLDGNMPAHGHGMNVTPVVTDNGDGTWTAEGMLFHMQGHWEMTVSISHMGMEAEVTTFNVMVGN